MVSYIKDEEMLAEKPVDSEIQPMGIGAVASYLAALFGISAIGGASLFPSFVSIKEVI